MSVPECEAPDHENRARPQLGRPPVLAGVQLADGGVQLQREVGDVRRTTEGAGRHHHVLRQQGVGADPQRIPTVRGFQPVDVDPGPDRQGEPVGVVGKVVGDLVLGRERPARSGEGQARQSVVAGRRVETQGVPVRPPVVAHPQVGVQDDEGSAPPLQVVAGGQAGLTGADDDGLDVSPSVLTGVPGGRPPGFRRCAHGGLRGVAGVTSERGGARTAGARRASAPT